MPLSAVLRALQPLTAVFTLQTLHFNFPSPSSCNPHSAALSLQSSLGSPHSQTADLALQPSSRCAVVAVALCLFDRSFDRSLTAALCCPRLVGASARGAAYFTAYLTAHTVGEWPVPEHGWGRPSPPPPPLSGRGAGRTGLAGRGPGLTGLSGRGPPPAQILRRCTYCLGFRDLGLCCAVRGWGVWGLGFWYGFKGGA